MGRRAKGKSVGASATYTCDHPRCAAKCTTLRGDTPAGWWSGKSRFRAVGPYGPYYPIRALCPAHKPQPR